MIRLEWELLILSRAVAYPNLSAAALHVNLSQPQLSRIVSKIEASLDVVLLDRSAKRKSGWTASAFKLAEVYANSARRLEAEIQTLIKQAEPEQIRIGTLEGLSDVASKSAHYLLENSSVKNLHLDIHDLNALEELFLSGELDLIFTSREPIRRKFKYLHELGYQTLESTVSAKPKSIKVYSTFEYSARPKAEKEANSFVSNSLELRRHWIKKLGGSGTIPSSLNYKGGHDKMPANSVAAFLIGADMLSHQIWDHVMSSLKKL